MNLISTYASAALENKAKSTSRVANLCYAKQFPKWC